MASVKYAYTITFKPILYKMVAEKQYDTMCLEVVKMLVNFGCRFTLVTELTKSYNIHLHGILQFKSVTLNIIKRFVDSFRNHKYIGWVNIKQITDEPGWIEYISKDLYVTKEMLDRRPILRDDLDIYNLSQRAHLAIEW